VKNDKKDWDKWFKTVIKKDDGSKGISKSYADKLRLLYRNLGSYPAFQDLRIPTSRLVQHSSEIKAFLDNHKDWAEYWRKESPEWQ